MPNKIQPQEGVYEIGCGIYDITGPAAEVGMMGFADAAQTTQGIYMRLWSRAFIIGDGNKRLVYICADLCMVYQAVKQAVVHKIQKDKDLNRFYNDQNILISATHTHSGPGGYSHHFMYNVTTKGFIRQNFEAIVNGIYQSIRRAHENLEPGKIFIARGEAQEYGFNRAKRPYAMNPEEERARYKSDIDQEMILLKFVSLKGEELGMVNWIGVHPTSVGPTNRLIGGDNKGLAEYWFERDKGSNVHAKKPFVAAFALAPSGDVSPNLWGIADGTNDYAHMEKIAKILYAKASELYLNATTSIVGALDYRHRYTDFSKIHIDVLGVDTAPAAMGATFLAGSTEDNVSQVKIFHDGATLNSLQRSEKIIASAVSSAFGALWPETLSREYIERQAPKQIILPTGLASWDGNPWTPQILPVQIFRLGTLALIAQPTEITTMAGRRVREKVESILSPLGVTHAVVVSHSNAYASYVTTPEEYRAQEYEGASTHFGPHTLDAFLQEYTHLSKALVQGYKVSQGVYPKDYSWSQISLQPGVLYDSAPKGKKFGSVLKDAKESYRIGEEVTVEFQSAHPRNDLMAMDNFAIVERRVQDSFEFVAGDRDPEITFTWERTRTSESKAILRWKTKDALPGEYRIVHRGVAKAFLWGKKTRFEGKSRSFFLKP
ncbi:MAG: Neutral ceramidase [Turneriella sp.]|nr:Neutral ceramidase [Turneriella sp.]